MDIQIIINTLEERGIRKVKLGIFDLDGIFRGKYVSFDKFLSAAESGMGFCDVIFGWDVNDDLYDRESLTGWQTGYPDACAKIDLTTFRTIPWEPDTALFIMDLYDHNGEPYPLSPRHLLQRVVERSEGLGYHPRLAAEYEYILFEETSHSIREKDYHDLKPLSPGMFGYSVVRASTYSDLVHGIIDAMADYDVELEGIHTETGPGVYETAIRYDKGVRAGDKAALFKTGIKELAPRHGLIATFMAKWNNDLPGCSGHIHQSLMDAEGKNNLFSNIEREHRLSEVAEHYLAGQLALMPALTALSCPTINSYKRAVPGVWSPINVSWGIENRTTAIRAIPGITQNSTRIEYRLTGADANPYLAMAAGLASGLYGIEHKVELPPVTAGNAYEAANLQPLPPNLTEATKWLDQSEAARDYLGDTFVDHFVMTREYEVRQYEKAVTNWELRRYFEAI